MIPYNFRIINSGSYDITDYVIDIDNIKIYERNKDYTPIITITNMTITNNISELHLPEIGEDIYITSSFGVVFTGFIDTMEYDYKDRSYKIACKNNLVKLQGEVILYRATEHDLYDDLVANATASWQYTADDNWYEDGKDGSPTANFQVLYVLKTMFEYVGLTLDSFQVDGIVLGQAGFITARRICIDKEMLFSINQEFAYPAWKIAEVPDYVARAITFWDFVSSFCSAFGFAIVPTGNKAFKLIHPFGFIARNISEIIFDDSIYEQSDKKEYSNFNVIQYGFKWAPRSWYYTDHTDYKLLNEPAGSPYWPVAVKTEAEKLMVNKGYVNWYNNLRFMTRANDTDGDIYLGTAIWDVQNYGDEASINPTPTPINYCPVVENLIINYNDVTYTTQIVSGSAYRYSRSGSIYEDLTLSVEIDLKNIQSKIIKSVEI